MKRVLIVNTSERTGGAAIAASRLLSALNKNGVMAEMLVRDKQTSNKAVNSIGKKWRMAARFIWERLVIFAASGFSKKNVWQVDIANVGTDITKTKAFKQADVIHLHWINQGFLSAKGLRNILSSKKKVVVTMHDMWYFTGICHYAGECEKYKTQCADCPLMKKRMLWKDYAKSLFKRKQNIYAASDITFVGCSKWMTDIAASSALTKGHKVINIPNAIDTDHFTPLPKEAARDHIRLPKHGTFILFGSQRITDPRKGFRYLVDACNYINEHYPQLAKKITVVVVGGNSKDVASSVPMKVVPVDYLTDELSMISLYNAVDLYVTPSLQDNLPNTIMEAMACGTPCVGFNVGGIPEMIDHQTTGYVAEYKNARDFAEGIAWCLSADRYDQLCEASRKKVEHTYAEKLVAAKYRNVYE